MSLGVLHFLLEFTFLRVTTNFLISSGLAGLKQEVLRAGWFEKSLKDLQDYKTNLALLGPTFVKRLQKFIESH